MRTGVQSAEPGQRAVLKRLGLVRSYVKGLPIWCSWQVTRRCASYCLFCEHRTESGEAEAGLPECERIVGELSRLGSLLVSLTGGDPFLRADLPEIIGLLSPNHIPILTTHGWLVTPSRARAVWEAGLTAASVTLDSADPVRQDARAGMPGAHARALDAIAAFAGERTQASQQVNVRARLDPGAPEEIEGLLNLAEALGVSVTVEPGFPLGAGEGEARRAGASIPVTGSVGSRLMELKRRFPRLRSSGWYLERIDRALAEGIPGCQAGRRFLNVDHCGRVSKCLEFQGPEDRVGDLVRDDARTLLPRLNRVQEANTCRACWYGSRGEVEGLYTLKGLLSAVPAMVRP